jgi:hypothetical protein
MYIIAIRIQTVIAGREAGASSFRHMERAARIEVSLSKTKYISEKTIMLVTMSLISPLDALPKKRICSILRKQMGSWA